MKWLNKYQVGGGLYISDRAKATQFGQYKKGGELTPEELASLNKAKMKAKMALAAEWGNPSAKRMVSHVPPTYRFTGNEMINGRPIGVPAGEMGTHFMSSMGEYAVPYIQQDDSNKMIFNPNASFRDREAMRFDTPEDAQYFAEHYKEVAPMMSSFKRGGGYFPDYHSYAPPRMKNGGDISIPDLDADKWLTKYDDGGSFDRKRQRQADKLTSFYNHLFDNISKRKDASFFNRALGSLETVFKHPGEAISSLFAKKEEIPDYLSNPYGVKIFSNQRNNRRKTWYPKYYIPGQSFNNNIYTSSPMDYSYGDYDNAQENYDLTTSPDKTSYSLTYTPGGGNEQKTIYYPTYDIWKEAIRRANLEKPGYRGGMVQPTEAGDRSYGSAILQGTPQFAIGGSIPSAQVGLILNDRKFPTPLSRESVDKYQKEYNEFYAPPKYHQSDDYFDAFYLNLKMKSPNITTVGPAWEISNVNNPTETWIEFGEKLQPSHKKRAEQGKIKAKFIKDYSSNKRDTSMDSFYSDLVKYLMKSKDYPYFKDGGPLDKYQIKGEVVDNSNKPYSKSNPTGYVSLKNNRDWFDSHANWTNTGNDKYDAWVRQKVLTGRFGVDPRSGALIKLPQSEWTNVSNEDKRLATDKRQWTPSQKQQSWEKQVKPQIVQSTKDLITNPVMMAPGAILTAGMAAGIPAVSRTAAAVMPALETSIGGIPGLTAGNLINAGFAYEGAKNIPNVANAWRQVASKPTWSNIGNAAGQTAVTGLDMLPFGMSAYKGIPSVMQDINQAGEYLTTQTPLRNAYKINPWAFKPNPEAYYRMIGKEGYADALESGMIRPKQYDDLMSLTSEGSFDFTPKKGQLFNEVYFDKGNLAEHYGGPYAVEYSSKTPLQEVSGYPKGYYVSNQNIPINDEGVKFLKQDWLRGYKQVPKPISNVVESTSAPLKSGFLGDIKQMFTNPKEYFTKPGKPIQVGSTQHFSFRPTAPQNFTDPRFRNIQSIADLHPDEFKQWDAFTNSRLENLKNRGVMYDQTGLANSDWLQPETIHYHGTYSGRPIVEVKMPNGNSEYFYKSSGWAGKQGAGVNGTTEGMWQVYDQHGLNFSQGQPIKNWFGKNSGYQDWYGSNTFRDFAGKMDQTLAKKYEIPHDELDQFLNFQNRSHNFDTFTPEYSSTHNIQSIVPTNKGDWYLKPIMAPGKRVVDWNKVGKTAAGAGIASGLVSGAAALNQKKKGGVIKTQDGNWLYKYQIKGEVKKEMPSIFNVDPRYTTGATESTGIQRVDPNILKKVENLKAQQRQTYLNQGRPSDLYQQRERYIKNKTYAAQQPNAAFDEQSGDVSRINPNRSVTGEAENFMSEREDKGREHWMNAIEAAGYLEGAGALGKALGKEALATGRELGEYLTTQTPLRNAYKINPFAVKENPEMFLYRARPVGQNVDMNMAAQIRAKQAAGEPLTPIQRNIMNNSKYKEYNPALYAREKYYGQWFEKDPSRLDWYIDPGTRNFADKDAIEILRTRLPKSEAAKLNVSQFDDAKILSSSPETEFILSKDMINSAERFPESSWQQLIQEHKKFNTPNWLRGYKQVPTSTPVFNLSNRIIDKPLSIATGNYLKNDLVTENMITPDELEAIRNRELAWLDNPEYIKRRMAATGETPEQVAKAIQDHKDNLNRTSLQIVEFPGGDLIGGEYAHPISGPTIRLNKFTNRDAALGTYDHEVGHATSQIHSLGNYPGYPRIKVGNPISRLFSQNLFYYNQPYEQQVRFQKLLKLMEDEIGIPRGQKITPEMYDAFSKQLLNSPRKNLINAKYDDVGGLLALIKNKYKSNYKNILIDALNKSYVTVPGALGIGAGAAAVSAQPEQKKKGGVIKDNNGYWNPENWGKTVQIDSNNITMKPHPITGQPVPVPLLGIGADGEQQMMYPGKDYKFRRGPVTEIPMYKENEWFNKYVYGGVSKTPTGFIPEIPRIFRKEYGGPLRKFHRGLMTGPGIF